MPSHHRHLRGFAARSLLALLLGAALTAAHGGSRFHDTRHAHAGGVVPIPIVESEWAQNARAARPDPVPDDGALDPPDAISGAGRCRGADALTAPAAAVPLRCSGLPAIRAPPRDLRTA